MRCNWRDGRWFAGLVLVVVFSAMSALAEEDVVARARALAYSGKHNREPAIALLKQHLAQQPDDSEAQVLYGIVLSWEGRYDESREQLANVLEKRPEHGDALPALINVELWSDHPDRAEQLALLVLAKRPDDIRFLLMHARALRNQNREREALRVLDRVLMLDPRNGEAKRMRRALSAIGKWETSLSHNYAWFSDGRDPQHETSFSLRRATPAGSLTGTISRADRFSLVSYQTELDFYPHFRSGTYGYLNVGYSADANLYPTYRLGGDLFQSLGKGYEVSAGYRRLQFSSGINILTFALAKYRGNWLFTARAFLTPGGPGTSRTGVFSARRFFGGEGRHDYLEVRYSRGLSPAIARTLVDIESLASRRFSAEIDKHMGGRWFANVGGGIAREQRVGLSDLNRYSFQGSVYYRF
jgi:YaiO family outer membrane protein